jgi:hypothetical protein
MVDEKNDSVKVSDAAESEFPPPAHFDENACAMAQPVRPIRVSGVAGWLQRASRVQRTLMLRSKAAALVVIGALAIGTLGGTILVKERRSTDAATMAHPSNAAPPSAADATQEVEPSHVILDAQASTTALQNAVNGSVRTRRHHARSRAQHRPRAYRVAVIRLRVP